MTYNVFSGTLNPTHSLSLPILTYGCDSIFISRTNMQKMNVCWNNVFRTIFSMNVCESVKCVQLLCVRLDFVHIAFQHKLKFLNGLYKASTLVIKECFRYVPYGAKFRKLCEDCDVLIDNGCLRFGTFIQSLSRYVVCSSCSTVCTLSVLSFVNVFLLPLW